MFSYNNIYIFLQKCFRMGGGMPPPIPHQTMSFRCTPIEYTSDKRIWNYIFIFIFTKKQECTVHTLKWLLHLWDLIYKKRLQLNRMQEQEQFKSFFYDKNKFYNEKDACIILLPSEVRMRKRSLHIVVGQNWAVLTHNKIENFTQN